jgi:hypothetical protein
MTGELTERVVRDSLEAARDLADLRPHVRVDPWRQGWDDDGHESQHALGR